MYVKVAGYGQEHFGYVHAHDGKRTLWVARPFPGKDISAVLHAGGSVYAATEARGIGQTDGALVRLDAESGQEVARVVVEGLGGSQARGIALFPKNNLLGIWGLHRLRLFHPETLELVWSGQPGVRRVEEKRLLRKPLVRFESAPPTEFSENGVAYMYGDGTVWEDAEGRIRALADPVANAKRGEQKPPTLGIFEIDPASEDVGFTVLGKHPQDRYSFDSVSPDGRYALRGAQTIALGEVLSEDENWLKVVEHQRIDLWDAIEGKPIRRIDVMDVPGKVFKSNNGVEALYAAAALCGESFFPPDKHVDVRGRPEDPLTLGAKLRSNQMSVAPMWEADSRAFWIGRGRAMRRIPVDGAPGRAIFLGRYLAPEEREVIESRSPMIGLGVGEVYPKERIMPALYDQVVIRGDVAVLSGIVREDHIPLAIATEPGDPVILEAKDQVQIEFPRIKIADIASQMPGLTRIKSWKPEAVAEGLANLTARVTEDITALFSGWGVTLAFAVGTKFHTEAEFFAALTKKNLDVSEPVHRLLRAWVDGLARAGLKPDGGEDGEGPFFHALQYLNALGREDMGLLRALCLHRDGEHESAFRNLLLEGAAHTARPIAERVSLCAFVEVLTTRDGYFLYDSDAGRSVPFWEELGVLAEAQQAMPPEDFGRIAAAEFSAFPQDPASGGNGALARDVARGNLMAMLAEDGSAWGAVARSKLVD